MSSHIDARDALEDLYGPEKARRMLKVARVRSRFAHNVRTRRLRLGLSQQDLARKAGMAQARISEYENSDVVPRLDTVAELADALDCSVAELVGETPRLLMPTGEPQRIRSDREDLLAQRMGKEGVRVATG